MAHLNWLLDEALKQTLPASDPVAIDIDRTRPAPGNGEEPISTPFHLTVPKSHGGLGLLL
jgi:hypothetical protein